MTAAAALALPLALLAGAASGATGQETLRVGSKKFTESVILAEMAVEMARGAGARVRHVKELGSTRVLWGALVAGEIDLYPEYTGTLAEELLRDASAVGGLPAALAARGIRMGRPLGFENGYAIGMREDVAERLGVTRLSDLAAHPGLRLGLSHEFLDRADGWPLLRERYGLGRLRPTGLDHDVAYRGLQGGEIDATDLYGTDAEIVALGLRVLEDDRHAFPPYQAVFLWRAEVETRAPAALAAVRRLEGRIGAPDARRMNARARLEHAPEAEVAAAFLRERLGVDAAVASPGRAARIARHTAEHLALVVAALLAAIAAGVPLGILAERRARLGGALLASAGLVQTVPSLALLVATLPWLGIGARPALFALFVYALLPIMRATHAGLRSVPEDVQASAGALGLPPWARLRLVELPMASRAILAGVKTSAVLCVGTATLGALVGAGGLGQPIFSGIRLDDFGLVLEGALPAAGLALLVQGAFGAAERWLVPRGLRLGDG
ncbi:MAG TPA: glycine betaine ABC transporter substrate-binding protein [Anaeromyxobacteraceae bacterium]|nr:glycine betaine ABC transporter substrate-binding protein [Anaeromyxobacteraceae bacterium]